MGTVMGTAGASMPACRCAFVSVCQSVSQSVCLSAAPQSVSTPQDGSNLEIGSTTNKARVAESRGRRSEEAGEKGGESRGHPFEFGRWWGNVGHAYLRKHCWREGSVIAGSE